MLSGLVLAMFSLTESQQLKILVDYNGNLYILYFLLLHKSEQLFSREKSAML